MSSYDIEDEKAHWYPMWRVLFEARGKTLSRFLEQKINGLYKIGIHLMQVDETRMMMFIADPSGDALERHWIPLYRDVLKLVK